MTPPPIRYPLPTLAVLLAAVLALAYGERWTRPIRAAASERIRRLTEGPPVPASKSPRVVAGAMVERVLLLRDGVPVSDRPGGQAIETLPRRQSLDVYDVWPLVGTPTHYRVGNRSPRGWVSASEVLPWNTRLVLTVPSGQIELRESADATSGQVIEVGQTALPVLEVRGGDVEVAVWGREKPWSAVSRRGWVKAVSLARESWGVLLSRDEVSILLRQLAGGAPSVKLRAVLGRLGSGGEVSPEVLKGALPTVVFDGRGKPEPLADLNTSQNADVSWGGIEFLVVPLNMIP